MRAWSWALLAGAGFALMLGAYSARFRPAAGTPCAYGFFVVGPEKPRAKPPGQPIAARVRLLPGNDGAEVFFSRLAEVLPGGGLSLQMQLRRRLIRLPLAEAGIGPALLQSGRLPDAEDEILAGAQAPELKRLQVGDRDVKIVGVLKPDVGLFAESYLGDGAEAASSLFPEGNSSVHRARVVGLTPEQFLDPGVMARFAPAYPAPEFVGFIPRGRLGRRLYYLYLLGQGSLLLGGSGLLIGLYRSLAGRIRRPWIAAPLCEIERRPRLVWGVHLVYFALVLIGSVVVYEFREVQSVLMAAVSAQIGGGSGPLGIAGKAYGSGNIPLAALVTFVVNFFLGSLVMITLPSMAVPGIGAGLAVVRATSWGLLLGPTFVATARAMIPHSFTMLLEGEGYILATFFALLVPLALVEGGKSEGVGGRFGRALLLNVQGNLWVAAVLAVAACYEATEVILMNR